MKKTKILATSLLSLSFFISFPQAGFSGGKGLWVDGKEKPSERVNTGIKAVTPDAYIRISEKVNSAVVNISTKKTVKRSPRGLQRKMIPRQKPDGQSPQSPQRGPHPFEEFFGDEFFNRFFGGPFGGPEQDTQERSLGSGFILNSDGYIVTNNHVVDRADEIRVVLTDESEHVAKVVGKDPKTDLALLKIDTKKKLTSVILGDSDKLRVGDIVVAIGNPFRLSHSLTQGIVSAKERSIGFGNYDDFIQTDASINPGNSGGPLLNLYGEVVGINTAIVSPMQGQGIGFAIPINMAKELISKLKEEGRVIRGWLGVFIQKVTDEHAKALKLKNKNGALISQVAEDGPAEKAGLRSGDVVTKFDGKTIKDWRDLPLVVANTKVGKKVSLDVVRDGKRKKLKVVVAELKDEEAKVAEAPSDKTDQLGLRVQGINPELARSFGLEEKTKGVIVVDVERGSPAYEKGIRRGDVVLEINRKKVSSASQYEKVVKGIKKKSTVLLLVKRGSGTLFIAFTL